MTERDTAGPLGPEDIASWVRSKVEGGEEVRHYEVIRRFREEGHNRREVSNAYHDAVHGGLIEEKAGGLLKVSSAAQVRQEGGTSRSGGPSASSGSTGRTRLTSEENSKWDIGLLLIVLGVLAIPLSLFLGASPPPQSDTWEGGEIDCDSQSTLDQVIIRREGLCEPFPTIGGILAGLILVGVGAVVRSDPDP